MSLFNLSPIGTYEFPCFGCHYMLRPKDETPHCFAIKVGIKKTEGVTEMLVKIPLSAKQKQLASELYDTLLHSSVYPVTVEFVNMKCYRYDIRGKIIYSATASDFIIKEE